MVHRWKPAFDGAVDASHRVARMENRSQQARRLRRDQQEERRRRMAQESAAARLDAAAAPGSPMASAQPQSSGEAPPQALQAAPLARVPDSPGDDAGAMYVLATQAAQEEEEDEACDASSLLKAPVIKPRKAKQTLTRKNKKGWMPDGLNGIMSPSPVSAGRTIDSPSYVDDGIEDSDEDVRTPGHALWRPHAEGYQQDSNIENLEIYQIDEAIRASYAAQDGADDGTDDGKDEPAAQAQGQQQQRQPAELMAEPAKLVLPEEEEEEDDDSSI